MNSLTNIATTPAPGSVQAYALAEKADATRRAYRIDFALFADWCAAHRKEEPLGASPETVAAFLAGQASAGVRPSTLTRRLAAISYAHRLAGLPSPAAHEVPSRLVWKLAERRVSGGPIVG